MSVNLMERAMELIGKQGISQIGGILGESVEKTQAAGGAGLAALIGGLIKKSSSPGGIDEVMHSMEGLDDGLLDNLGDILGGGDQSGLMNAGSGILEMIFGRGLSSVFDVLTKSTGMGTKSITSLVTGLAPILMGLLKRESASSSLDAAGLTNLLSSQTDFIQDKLPSGFGDLLGLSGLSSAAGTVAASAANEIRNASNSAAGSGSMLGKLLPLIGLIALAYIAFQVFSNNEGETTEGDPPAAVELKEGEEIEFEEVDVQLNLNGPGGDFGTEEAADATSDSGE